jgi:uncharacterized protein YqhQ
VDLLLEIINFNAESREKDAEPTNPKKKKVKKKVSMINLGIIGKMCSFFFGSNEFELIDCVIKSG